MPPAIPIVSNVTGTYLTAEQAMSPDAWADHLCEAVRLADGIGTLSLNLRPADGGFSLAADGTIRTGLTPDFKGTMTWRQPPPKPVEGTEADAGRGDFVLTT